MQAVFRADASAEIGGGHVMRCLTLAHALEQAGWRCAFAVNQAAAATVSALAARQPRIVAGPPAESAGALRELWPEGVDWLVVDHYGIARETESACRSWAGAILVLDDLADRPHDCDILVDQTFGRDAEDYTPLVPADCRLLTGSDFALLRPEFAAARPASLARRRSGGELQRLLVSLGATDPENHSAEVLRGIAESALPLAVDVVLGSGAPHLAAVKDLIAAMPQDVRLHIDTTKMQDLMTSADLAIGAAGTSTWERCCLGLPSLLLVIAENQRRIAAQVAGAGAARLLTGPRPVLAGQVAAALGELSRDGAALNAMAVQAATICDGLGAARVAAALGAQVETASPAQAAGEPR